MKRDSTSSMYLHEIATAVPEKCLYTNGSAGVLEETCVSRRGVKLLQRLARLTGIEKRHLAILEFQSTLTDEAAIYRPACDQPRGPGMGARTEAFDQAADRLVGRLLSGISEERLADVRTLVTVSCTHASSPGLERPVFAHTGVPAGVDRWNLGFMGCSAALAALRLVHQTAAMGRRTLVVACELSSLHFQYTDQTDQMSANLLFGDGAAAMLLSSEVSPIRLVGGQCAALPAFAEQMAWWADDHGLMLRLSPELPDTLGAHLPAEVGSFLDAHGMAISDVDHWIVHPGGPQILDSVRDSLGLEEEAMRYSRSVLREYGNMSSPTVVFVLNEMLAQGGSGRAVLMAFGPGLTIELVLLEIER